MNTLEVIRNWVKKDSDILDLGCGKGEILKYLSEKGNNYIHYYVNLILAVVSAKQNYAGE